jgi:hypothetical protein
VRAADAFATRLERGRKAYASREATRLISKDELSLSTCSGLNTEKAVNTHRECMFTSRDVLSHDTCNSLNTEKAVNTHKSAHIQAGVNEQGRTVSQHLQQFEHRKGCDHT